MFSLGTSEILVILVVALVVFGKRLPEVSRSLGKALSEFRRGLYGLQREFQDELTREEVPAAPRPQPAPVQPEVAATSLPIQPSPPPSPAARPSPPASLAGPPTAQASPETSVPTPSSSTL